MIQEQCPLLSGKGCFMFERYNQNARRVIFFARYEASNYGSPSIETEHLLLGFLREDRVLAERFLGRTRAESEIRAEIESRIERREPFGVSVEVPLSTDSKKVLNIAAEEAERLGHRYIGTEHMLLGLLRVEGSLAAQILRASGLKPAEIRGQLAKAIDPANVKSPPHSAALSKLENFLAGLKWHGAEELVAFFTQNAQFVDVYGKRWNREEIGKQFETLFAPYAKKNTTYMVEETIQDSYGFVIAIVLWKNAILASLERVWMHRMSVVLVPEGEEWAIVLIHATPVKPS